MQDTIVILDFGSQYTQLIARRVRELNVYCEIYPFDKFPGLNSSVKGVILSGSPYSVRDPKAPRPELDYAGKIPVLGVCYGAQLIVHLSGGEVRVSKTREFGRAKFSYLKTENPLLRSLSKDSQVWMSHSDTISRLPDRFEAIASTQDVEFAGFKVKDENTFGIQFHPEVYHSTQGSVLLKNFTVGICGCSQSWTADSFIENSVSELNKTLGSDKVMLALSGGVDSTVAACLLNKAVGKNLYCIFVDNGLLRKNEYEHVLHSYLEMGLNIKGVNAKEQFYSELSGITDPELKRKTIGRIFIEIFDLESQQIEDVRWLAQGTIYPDIIESYSVNGPSATIKSHHNVGGLPENMKLKVVEPLKSLFKDEVRVIGKTLGVPDGILNRHPFPGPGLAIRILGEITRERVVILQNIDNIFIEGLKKEGLYKEVWQAGAILLPIQSVGVMGDERTYENVVALRAVSSTDGMTADWCHLPHDFLARISSQIINHVKGVNRVVYDISSKPPATIEWE